MLDTRTKFGQFVMTLQYVCKFANAMMTPIQILPKALADRKTDRQNVISVKKRNESEEILSEMLSEMLSNDTNGVDCDDGYGLASDQKKKIP